MSTLHKKITGTCRLCSSRYRESEGRLKLNAEVNCSTDRTERDSTKVSRCPGSILKLHDPYECTVK